MLKSSIRALCCIAIAASYLISAPAKADVIEYGARQVRTVVRGEGKTKSNATWVSKSFGRVLNLECLKDSLPHNSPNAVIDESISRAAAIMDFTQDNPRGLNVTYFLFKYHKLRSGTFFKETTDPIVRVQYIQGFDTYYKTIPLRVSGYDSRGFSTVQYNKFDLKEFGLDPLYVNILRIGVIAKPKYFTYVDDYASMEVTGFSYKVYGNDTIVYPVEDFAIRDGSYDPLLNGA